MSRQSQLRSIAYHREIAQHLNAELMALALANLIRAEMRDTTHQAYIARWRQLLAGPREVLIAALQADDEVMRDLRQCTPFAGALTPQRRWQLWASVDPAQP